MTNTDIIFEARDVFHRRQAEVTLYLDFLLDVVDRRPKLKFADQELDFDRSLVKIMLANGYLLLYNMVEATMTNGIDAIHQKIKQDNAEYDSLRRELKLIVLRQFKATSTDAIMESVGILHTDIIHCGYKRDDLFSGNLDARKIRGVAEDYGFEPQHVEESFGGARLLEVKERRNKLAHGSISFEECGQDSSIDHLRKIHSEVVAYLNAILLSIEDYINEKKYLSSGGEVRIAS